MMEATKANAEAMTSQAADLRNSTRSGRRQEASMSAGEFVGILGNCTYSNWLGFSGAFGGSAVAFSTRAMRLERPGKTD